MSVVKKNTILRDDHDLIEAAIQLDEECSGAIISDTITIGDASGGGNDGSGNNSAVNADIDIMNRVLAARPYIAGNEFNSEKIDKRNIIVSPAGSLRLITASSSSSISPPNNSIEANSTLSSEAKLKISADNNKDGTSAIPPLLLVPFSQQEYLHRFGRGRINVDEVKETTLTALNKIRKRRNEALIREAMQEVNRVSKSQDSQSVSVPVSVSPRQTSATEIQMPVSPSSGQKNLSKLSTDFGDDEQAGVQLSNTTPHRAKSITTPVSTQKNGARGNSSRSSHKSTSHKENKHGFFKESEPVIPSHTPVDSQALRYSPKSISTSTPTEKQTVHVPLPGVATIVNSDKGGVVSGGASTCPTPSPKRSPIPTPTGSGKQHNHSDHAITQLPDSKKNSRKIKLPADSTGTEKKTEGRALQTEGSSCIIS